MELEYKGEKNLQSIGFRMTLIPISEAIGAIAAACNPAPENTIPIEEALGAVPARSAVGVVASPPFNNAAMDGFAVRAEDTVGATQASPVELPVLGELRVGAFAQAASPDLRGALRVATGALTPPPLDAVVALEQAAVIERRGSAFLRLTRPVEEGRNLRIMGEEYPAGAAFDFIGKRLNAGHIALLSAAGISELSVRTPPPVALLTTGNEVRPPGAMLAPGEISNVNASWLAAWCAERRLPVAVLRHVADDAGKLAREFLGARECGARVLISSGSASTGRHDVVRAALEILKARIVFHGVAMRPGKPVLFALLEDGTPVFGLAGNPLATAAGMRFVAWAGIRRILGMDNEQSQPARLAHSLELRSGFTHFVLARRTGDEGLVDLVHPQRPGQAGALAAADCWLRFAGGRTDAGTRVDSYPL